MKSEVVISKVDRLFRVLLLVVTVTSGRCRLVDRTAPRAPAAPPAAARVRQLALIVRQVPLSVRHAPLKPTGRAHVPVGQVTRRVHRLRRISHRSPRDIMLCGLPRASVVLRIHVITVQLAITDRIVKLGISNSSVINRVLVPRTTTVTDETFSVRVVVTGTGIVIVVGVDVDVDVCVAGPVDRRGVDARGGGVGAGRGGSLAVVRREVEARPLGVVVVAARVVVERRVLVALFAELLLFALRGRHFGRVLFPPFCSSVLEPHLRTRKGLFE